MSDLKHTPGPWSCMSESEHEGVYLDDCVHSVSKAAGRADIICLSPSHEDYELSAAMWDANARLIAAAPELYEAVAAVINATRDYLPPDGITKEEFISRVIAATDNARMAEIMK